MSDALNEALPQYEELQKVATYIDGYPCVSKWKFCKYSGVLGRYYKYPLSENSLEYWIQVYGLTAIVRGEGYKRRLYYRLCCLREVALFRARNAGARGNKGFAIMMEKQGCGSRYQTFRRLRQATAGKPIQELPEELGTIP